MYPMEKCVICGKDAYAHWSESRSKRGTSGRRGNLALPVCEECDKFVYNIVWMRFQRREQKETNSYRAFHYLAEHPWLLFLRENYAEKS